ncbi:MAG: hypothetical protein IT166_03160 [Bryobacterales bacterium]|nr:hypothetical protein [Bryobacterales bacterium]
MTRIIHSPSPRAVPPQTTAAAALRDRKRTPAFESALNRALPQPATSRQQSGNPAAPTVVLSPFNPLGLPVCTTPAPTAAEVAANPAKFTGTSFDPARYIDWHFSKEESSGGLASVPTQAPPIPRADGPPAGSVATNDPNVFVTASGASWNRPGTLSVFPDSSGYDQWRLKTFGIQGSA